MLSCQGDDCSGFGNSLQNLMNMQLASFRFQEDGESRTFTTIVEDSLRYDTFAIVLNAEFESATQLEVSSSMFSFLLLQPAYACSPVPPYTKDEILSIEITGNKSYNSNLPSGSDLSMLFDIIDYNGFGTIINERTDLITFLRSEKRVPRYMTLVLKDAPETAVEIVFTVKIELNTLGRDSYEFITESLVIIPN